MLVRLIITRFIGVVEVSQPKKRTVPQGGHKSIVSIKDKLVPKQQCFEPLIIKLESQ